MSGIIVAGINGSHIPENVRGFLEDCHCPVFCSQAMIDVVKESIAQFDINRWSSIVPISKCFEKIREKQKQRKVIVLVSGDPLFYGLGTKLKETFTDNKITFLPGVSYMQSCFSHFGINWDDAEFISLHGRELASMETKLNTSKLFIYTDPDNSPEVIARYLKQRLDRKDLESMQIFVGECIGTDKQKFTKGGIDDISAMNFSQPNCMILLNTGNAGSRPVKELPKLGLGEKDVQHSRGLITKSEVRAAVIHRLRLPEQGVLWDIGAGSGSISLEAARLCQSLSVFAIEKEEEQLANIRANKDIYQCRNISLVSGEAPAVLPKLAVPDRVFIGGSGGKLEEIINHVAGAVRDDGRIVITAVLPTTAELTLKILHRHKFNVDISLIQVTRYCYPDLQKSELNPIYLICGTKNI